LEICAREILAGVTVHGGKTHTIQKKRNNAMKGSCDFFVLEIDSGRLELPEVRRRCLELVVAGRRLKFRKALKTTAGKKSRRWKRGSSVTFPSVDVLVTEGLVLANLLKTGARGSPANVRGVSTRLLPEPVLAVESPGAGCGTLLSGVDTASDGNSRKPVRTASDSITAGSSNRGGFIRASALPSTALDVVPGDAAVLLDWASLTVKVAVIVHVSHPHLAVGVRVTQVGANFIRGSLTAHDFQDDALFDAALFAEAVSGPGRRSYDALSPNQLGSRATSDDGSRGWRGTGRGVLDPAPKD